MKVDVSIIYISRIFNFIDLLATNSSFIQIFRFSFEVIFAPLMPICNPIINVLLTETLSFALMVQRMTNSLIHLVYHNF